MLVHVAGKAESFRLLLPGTTSWRLCSTMGWHYVIVLHGYPFIGVTAAVDYTVSSHLWLLS